MRITVPSSAAASTSSAEFTTRMFPEREGFSYWQDEICRHLSPALTERSAPASPFVGTLKRVVIGKAGVCDISFSPMRNLRDGRCLRKMPDDDFFVAVMRDGTGHLQQCGRSAELAAGDVVLYNSSRAFEWRFGEPSRMLVARISRPNMVARLPNVDELTARIILAAHPSASIIGETIKNLVRLDGALTEGCAQRLGSTLIDLVTSSVEAYLEAREPSSANVQILQRAKTYLLENIENPELNLDEVSNHLSASVRTLCRAFASEGTSPIRWLWQQRLELANRLLHKSHIEHVSQVAMLCGFSDFSHFSRAFKKTYGVSPKLVLKGTSDTLQL